MRHSRQHQFVNFVDWMAVSVLGQGIAQIGFWIGAVELGVLQEGVDGRGPHTARSGPGEQIVFSAQSYTPHSVLDNVVFHLEPPVGDEPLQRHAAVDGVVESAC